MATGGGLKFTENIFAKNTLESDPNMRDDVPIVEQFIRFTGTLSSGVKAQDNIPSPFGLGHGTVIGAYLLNSKDATNHVLSCVAVAGAGVGTIKITLESTNASASTALANVPVMVLGQILPKSV